MINLYVLGSGSRGNSLVIRRDGRAIMIDAGFSRRELRRRLTALGGDPAEIAGVLLTHEHNDHLDGARVFCDEQEIPLCAASGTLGYLRGRERRGGARKLPKRLLSFEAGESFALEEFAVETFPVQHDAADPVGFVIRCGEFRVGVATDLGEVNPVAERHLRDCDVLVLESNYDAGMLRNSDRHLDLKRRIAGRHGHLDNTAAAAALERLLTDRTRFLMLAHMSSECNTRSIVNEAISAGLCRIGRGGVPFAILDQDAPLVVDEAGGGALEVRNAG